MLDKKILILNALEDIIKTKRYHEVTIEDIAKKCKIGKGSIYTYFKSKDEMFYELSMHGLEAFTQEINSIDTEGVDIKEVIFCVAKKLSVFFEKREAVIRVLQELGRRTKIMTKARKERMFHNREALRLAFARIIQIGIDKGIVRDSYSLMQLTELLIHTLIGRAHWDKDVAQMSVEDLTSLILFK